MPRSSTSEIIPLYGFTPAQFLVIVVEIVEKLSWEIDYLSKAGLVAFAHLPGSDKRIKIIVKIERFTARLSGFTIDQECQDNTTCQQAMAFFLLSLHYSNRAYALNELEQRFEAMKPRLSPPDDSRLNLDVAPLAQTWDEILSVFTPRREYFITPWLILVNTAIFFVVTLIALVFDVDRESIISLGANSRAVSVKGEVWRLLSSVFLHWDLVHLFVNMFALYFVGTVLEPYLDKIKFTAVYLLVGLLAGIASLWWHRQALSAGASGAVFGLYGIFLAWLTTNLLEPGVRKNLLVGTILFIASGLLGGTKGNIDNAAHIGGLISGIVMGYFLYPWLKKQSHLVAER